MLKPDLEIFKTAKSSQKVLERKLLTFPSVMLGLLLCLFCLGGSLALPPQNSFHGSDERSLLFSARQWQLLITITIIIIIRLHFSLKSLTLETLGLLNLKSVFPWLQPALNPGSVWSRGGLWPLPSLCCFHSPQHQPKGPDKKQRWCQCSLFQFPHSRTLWNSFF